MGQTGEPRPGKLADRAVFDRPKRTVRDPVVGEASSLFSGEVSLTPGAQRPVEVERLLPLGAMGWPPVVRTWVALANRHGRRFEVYRQVVRPVSARSRLLNRTVEAVYVRVWVAGGPMVFRSWTRTVGAEKWATGTCSTWGGWRGRMIPLKKISVKEAKEIIVVGGA